MQEQTQAQEQDSFLGDLLDFINGEEAQELGIIQEGEGFVISSTEQANYFARKLRELREEKSQVEVAAKQQVDAYKERVDKWLNKTIAPLEYEEERLLNMLQFFAYAQLEGSSKKSIKLVEGTLQFRKQQPSIEYNDEVLMDFVKTKHPEYIAIKESIDKKSLKSAFTIKDGNAYLGKEVIPGITTEARDDAFDVK